MKEIFAVLLLIHVCGRLSTTPPPAEVVYEWVSIDYDWPNNTTKPSTFSSGKYIRENNIIAGVKVYKDDVYVTVPRWREGVPSSLNRVIVKNGKPILQPFPDWKSHTVGDCDALQYVHSMEVDPKRGWMWIIDIGRLDILPGGTPRNLCPPKILVYDINTASYVKRYVFPASVASPATNFLNDIVLDVINDKPTYAYITDTSFNDPGLVVYNFQHNTSHRFSHKSMGPEPEGRSITINNVTYAMAAPMDGIALSPDSKYVYYCALAAYSLFQVPTNVVRNPSADFASAVKNVGKKVSPADGLAYGQKNLFFGALDRNAVYKWRIDADAKAQHGYANVQMKTQTPVVSDNARMEWVDTFAFDEHGYLWFTANRLQPFFQNTMNFSDSNSTPNVRIWKVYVGEKGYLHHADKADPSIIG
ncbi:LOW QUALITY PROTEIN: protein yellow-like [Liolophura sinensis]|uniref:LOW QUALITY PROTEIN: protein yellow-like n=1 Tax=Liolophura sinensis TaxID=3198878 RepID=UPI0031596B4D